MSQPSQRDPATLRYFVDGMDCASCARKIEDMVTRLPGVAATKVNFSSQMLTLELDESRTPRTKLEANIRTLGYAPTLSVETSKPAAHGEAGHDHGHGAPTHTHALEGAWYATRQAQLVMLTGEIGRAHV